MAGINATASTVASSTSATTLLSARAAGRQGASIYYDGAAILYLLMGDGTPSSTNYTVKLGTGYYTLWEAPLGERGGAYRGAVQGIWDSAVGSAQVTEVL